MEALQLCEQALASDANNSEVLHLAAIAAAHLNQLDQALAFIQRALNADHDNPQLLNSYGNILLRHHRVDEAIEAFENAIQFKPDYAAAYNNLGNAHFRQQQFALARKAYEKALDFDIKFAESFFNLARVAITEDNFEEAKSSLQRVIQLNPRHYRALTQLGQIELQEEHWEQAAELFEKSLVLQPAQANALSALGTIRLQQHHYADAVTLLTHALEIHPEIKLANWHLATAYLAQNNIELALQHYLRELAIEPHADCYYNAGVLYGYQNKFIEAAEYLEHSLKMDPSYFPAQLNLAALYLKQHKIKEAIVHYQKALDLKPNDPEITHILHALQQDQNPEKAPDSFAAHLFDQYAPHYDQHLTQHLKFSVPQLVFNAVAEKITDRKNLRILDLGCGTGLSAEAFAPFASELIGVDLSEKMLALAKAKKIYHRLKQADLESTLVNFNNLDLIIAGDVFSYIGALDTIFKLAYDALKSGGIFVFTTEISEEKDFHLSQAVRYQHHKHYLNRLIEKNKFKKIHFETAELRQQFREPVMGYVVALEK